MKQNTKDWIQYSMASLLIVSAAAMGFVSLLLTMEIGTGPLAFIAETLSAALAIQRHAINGDYAENAQEYEEYNTWCQYAVATVKRWVLG